MWWRNPSMGEFTTFSMTALTLVAKVWYNFLCAKIKPSLHLSTVTKDKTILLYAVTKGFKFDIETVIERGLIGSTRERCTSSLIHPSLIIELCRSVGVSMLDSKEQVQQRLSIQLLRVKFGTLDESNDETDDDAPATTPSASDPVDGDPEVPSSSTQSLADQIHELTSRFDAYWDESQEHRVTLSQDMDSIRAKMAAIHASQNQIAQRLAQLLSFHIVPPSPPP